MSGDIYARVGAAIRAKREEVGMTQAALAERTGLGRTSITNMERGGQSILLHQLIQLAQALRADPREFLSPIDDEKPEPVTPSEQMAALLERLASHKQAERR